MEKESIRATRKNRKRKETGTSWKGALLRVLECRVDERLNQNTKGGEGDRAEGFY